ncbi:TPA: EAL domain-containing protein [Klebsiella variicola subsp. variicola]
MRPIFSICPPALEVTAFGRRLFLSPWFEPIWSRDGRLAALELLSRIHDRDTGKLLSPEDFFLKAQDSEQFQVLNWQLQILSLMTPWCNSHDVPVSINISRTVAKLILLDLNTQETMLRLAPHLRLEISEKFMPAGLLPEQDTFLPRLKLLAPLWLDDFGVGSNELLLLMSGVFEAIKIDRILLERLHKFPDGHIFFSGLCELARNAHVHVIAEGVSDNFLQDFANSAKVTSCQGWLWPGFTLEKLYLLPEIIPRDFVD